MVEIISTKERICISSVGPSGSGTSHMIFFWMKTGTFEQENDKKIFTFIKIINLFVVKCTKKQ